VPAQTPPGRDHRRDAEDGAADAQRNHHDVPEGTTEIDRRKVEAVETLVQPASQPRDGNRTLDDPAALGIEVQPRAVLVGISHAKHG
jgi:hypothetical protein